MKILASTFEFFSRDPRAYKIDKALAKEHEVTAFVRKEDLTAFDNASVSFSLFREAEPRNKYYRLFSFWKDLISFAKTFKPDVFVAHNYYLVLAAYLIKKKTGCKVVYDSYELYVPSKRNKLPRRQMLFYYIERFCINSFDLVISANEERARLMKSKFKLKERPLSIMNISSSLFKQEDKDVVAEKYPYLSSYKDKVKLVYQGVLSGDRELIYFIDIIKELGDRFALIFIGEGPEKDALIERTQRLGVKDQVLFTGRVPMNDVNPILSYCDYGLVSYPFGDYNNRYCAPNKIFEYPGAGLPMISSSQATIETITRGYCIIQFVTYSDTKNASQKILEFTNTINKITAQDDIKRYLYDINWNHEENKLLAAINRL